MIPHAFAVWPSGPAAAGKSTLAREVTAQLLARGLPVALLDAAVLGPELWPELADHPRRDHEISLRLARLAARLMGLGLACVVDAEAPRLATRREVRRLVGELAEVGLSCPLEQRLNREAAGRVAAALAQGGEAFEPPERAEVTCATDREPPAACAARVLAYLEAVELLTPAGAPDQGPAPSPYTPDQADEIKRRLEALGYI